MANTAKMTSTRQFGTTPPISTNPPTEMEKQSNQTLLRELRDQGTFESPAETQTREEVLDSLRKIANTFVAKVAEAKEPKNAVLIRDARGCIFTYGSYRLGVFGPGSDIDTICIGPNYVTHEDFFEFFPPLLLEMTRPGEIKDLSLVPVAFVPIIKFEYRGISIDLIFSAIQSLKQIPLNKDWNLSDVNLLRGMNDTMSHSINGPRVTDDILRCVPEEHTFKLALRAIKLWAKKRGLYGAIYGFPGGVAWAIMVARTCQLFPKATSSVIVNRFFRLYLRWPWPEPVLLREIEDAGLNHRTWNPKIYGGDRRHIFPVITPTYPALCTTNNVTKSAKAVIMEELERGFKLTGEMVAGQRPWKDLFQKHTFFTQDYRYYMTITSVSRSKEAHKPWSGFIESRSRHLAMDVENHHAIQLARPYVKAYDRVHMCKTVADYSAVENGSMAFLIKDPEVLAKAEAKVEAMAAAEEAAKAAAEALANGTSLPASEVKTEGVNGEKNGVVEVAAETGVQNGAKTEDDEDGSFLVYTTTQYLGLKLAERAKPDDGNPGARVKESIDLSHQCNRFMTECCERFDNYNVKMNTLKLSQIPAKFLPDDVFDKGEERPRRAPRKRPATTDPDPNPHPVKRQQTAAA